MLATAFRLLALLATLLPFGCATPPPDAYVHGAQADGARPAAQLSIGKNSVGEDCTQQAGSGQGAAAGADVFCGTWQQPSARVRSGGPGSAAQLAQLAAASPWRSGIDIRYRCDAPVATTILGGDPAELMQCTQRVGGWAHVAMVALVNDTIWYCDGVLPAAQVMQRSIGVLAGVERADAVAPTSGADALLASRLAAKAFSSGDIGQFDALMAAGTRANLADNPAAAESAFRAALALQQKALGSDNPNTATALMSLALQLSNEGRYAEADALFADAVRLAPKSADPAAQARLFHYRGLDAMNQGQLASGIDPADPGRCRLRRLGAGGCADGEAKAQRRQQLRPRRTDQSGGPDAQPGTAHRSARAGSAARPDRGTAQSLRGAAHHGSGRRGAGGADVGKRPRARQRPVAAHRQCAAVPHQCGDGRGAGAGRSGAERPAAIDRGVRPVAAWLEAAGRHVSAARAPVAEGRQGRPLRCRSVTTRCSR